MTNSATYKTMRQLPIVAALLLLVLGAGCGVSHDDSSSSGSHWLSCEVDGDCTSADAHASCAADGFCVDARGARLVAPSDAGTAGAGAGAGGRSGTGGGGAGGAAGAGTGGTGGSPAGTGGESGTAGSSSADSGVGVALPDCAARAVGDDCSFREPDPLPECCDGSNHLRCEITACTDAIPPSCFGVYERVVGSGLCGGYAPCEGKQCGDSCDRCDPADPSCAMGDALSTCDSSGACIVGMADCTEPAMCDPLAANSCGSGSACCAVGRCGPIETGDGICEPADPETGACMRCACETQPGGCPICNSPGTPIATPDGERAIAELREGDLVMSMHRGRLVAVPVIATRQVRVLDHAVARVTFESGRVIEVSGSHPTAWGTRLDALQPGDAVGDARVLSVELVPYGFDRTYDILPASDSGTYLAGGALLSSTLAAPLGGSVQTAQF